MRACESCTLCCKVLEVPELAKPAQRWCPHASRGAGCAIYAERPATCRAFECGWQQGWVDEVCRPDRIHAVVSGQITDGHLGIFEDTGYPGEARERLTTLIAETCRKGKVVVVVRGARRQVFGTARALASVARPA